MWKGVSKASKAYSTPGNMKLVVPLPVMSVFSYEFLLLSTCGSFSRNIAECHRNIHNSRSFFAALNSTCVFYIIPLLFSCEGRQRSLEILHFQMFFSYFLIFHKRGSVTRRRDIFSTGFSTFSARFRLVLVQSTSRIYDLH